VKGPLDRWRAVRKSIHDRVCEQGFDPALNSFVQAIGSKLLDASVLIIPLVGFLKPDDSRVKGTIEAIRHHLLRDGFVVRYDTGKTEDGLPPGEGAFLPCTFWLADNLALAGQTDDALELFDRLLGLRNDVGLLSEEYDPRQNRQLGNFPQAFSHIGLINTALNLSGTGKGPAEQRRTQ
jgi:GH15 family glucan-1,4-alpha-glucosidase